MLFVLQTFILFSFVLLHAAVADECVKSESQKWSSCRWDKKDTSPRKYVIGKDPAPHRAHQYRFRDYCKKRPKFSSKKKGQISTQAVLDCFGSCSITSPLYILNNLRRECRKKREDWDMWILFDIPAGLYPDYDGASHKCRINDAHKPYFANICIEYKLHSEKGGEAQLQSLDQLKALIERGIVMAVLKVKRGFREYTLDLDHVYDSKKDRTAYETEMHSVLLLGYRTNGKQTHLLIQNPWRVGGTVPWGEKGYAWVAVHSITTMELNDQIYTLNAIPPPLKFFNNLFM